jgi:tRNA A-37 threonylcarbamoyl transferase component Bud32
MGSDEASYASGVQLPGTVYRVVRHLATGGMGSVYDVEDVTVGKRYVLKTLHPQLVARQDLARRMEAEARTLAKLQHPNIVDVVTAGVTQDVMRMPFYVMERLNGQNLRVLLEKRGMLELTPSFRIAIDVLDALEHAHENQVIHRDVKPDNIFLHRQMSGTTITKLLDFGIVRLLDQKSLTAGKFIGTLRYASPEQIMGGDLGPATDLYSLGLVLYEMIAGRGPFDEIRDAYEVGIAHVQKAPPPLSAFTRVPTGVEALVMSAIAKEPRCRPRDAFTFAGELRRMLRDEEAAPSSTTAVNMLTVAPPTQAMGRARDPAFAGTEPVGRVERAERAGIVTETGIETELELPLPLTAPVSDGAGVTFTAEGMSPPTQPVARTARSLGVEPTHLAGHGSGAPRPVDRHAATQTRVPFGAAAPLARNGTEIDASGPHVELVQAALAQPGPLVVPPVDARSSVPPASELVFPSASAPSLRGTGPMAGEARTRPPDVRSAAVVVPIVAVLLGLVTVGAWAARAKLAGRAASVPAASSGPSAVAPAASPSTVPAKPDPSAASSAPSASSSSSSSSSSPALRAPPASFASARASGPKAPSPRPASSPPSPPSPPKVLHMDD